MHYQDNEQVTMAKADFFPIEVSSYRAACELLSIQRMKVASSADDSNSVYYIHYENKRLTESDTNVLFNSIFIKCFEEKTILMRKYSKNKDYLNHSFSELFAVIKTLADLIENDDELDKQLFPIYLKTLGIRGFGLHYKDELINKDIAGILELRDFLINVLDSNEDLHDLEEDIYNYMDKCIYPAINQLKEELTGDLLEAYLDVNNYKNVVKHVKALEHVMKKNLLHINNALVKELNLIDLPRNELVNIVGKEKSTFYGSVNYLFEDIVTLSDKSTLKLTNYAKIICMFISKQDLYAIVTSNRISTTEDYDHTINLALLPVSAVIKY